MYTVKQVSQMLNLSEHTIRYYTDKKLVPGLKRDENNIRIFDQQALNWLKGIKYLKKCGMPLSSIKHFMDLCEEGDATLADRYTILLEQSKRAKKQLEEMKETVEYMDYKLERYTNIMNHAISDDMNPSKWDKI